MNFYKQAADILTKLSAREGSIKSLTLANTVKEKKKMYALICETLKYKDVINKIIDNSQLLKVEKKLPKNIAILLVHDLLFSSEGLKNLSDGPYKIAIMRNEIILRAELVKLKIKSKVKNNEDLISSDYRNAVVLPRYVRVNTLKTTVKKVIEHFQLEGYVLEESIKVLSDISTRTIRKDCHLPDLLILPPKTDLHDHPLYLSGEIILQDKASCFPAYICSPQIDSHVIDACAAPGNKTSHLSAIMKNTGKIWAFDLDKKRLKLLEKLTQKAGCKNIEAVHGSFLDVDPLDERYSKVEYILLDPSCSGSGIVNRLDKLVDAFDQETDQSDTSQNLQDLRLKNLSEFQGKIILHAFKFPSAKRIVYSTCSIHPQENEQVIQRVLKQTETFLLANRNDVVPTWDRRGISSEFNDEETAVKLIRTLPEDFMNGFFVACFIRVSENDNTSNLVTSTNITNDLTNSKKRKRKRKKSKTIRENVELNKKIK